MFYQLLSWDFKSLPDVSPTKRHAQKVLIHLVVEFDVFQWRMRQVGSKTKNGAIKRM